ncbi:hypothetical protein HPB52_010702 [Rhipicephalus sanguineus]|uniref:Uncharacterized protein n=1 Tax=Rhipicephalus sanguineus TaxID=34632 RepID=A0A9D4Q0A5_RHISA|nr:hypothetical protein HPB52_010702 [Rhipicephalus sanguineus]
MEERQDSLDGWVAIRENLFEPSASLQSATPEGERHACDRDTCAARAALLSSDALHDIHKQLVLMCPALENSFPLTDSQTKGSWNFLRFFSKKNGVCERLDSSVEGKVCRELEYYFKQALDATGKRLLFSLLFGEEDYLTDYEEDIQELRLRGLERTLERAYDELNEILSLRSLSETMLNLSTVYALEDQVVLGPFLELREVAAERSRALRLRADDGRLGPRVRAEATKELEEWDARAQSAN